MESLPAMLVILVLVLAAVGITLWQVITGAQETFALWIFGLVVLGIFIYDFFMRLYCYWYVYGSSEVSTFLCNSFGISYFCVRNSSPWPKTVISYYSVWTVCATIPFMHCQDASIVKGAWP